MSSSSKISFVWQHDLSEAWHGSKKTRQEIYPGRQLTALRLAEAISSAASAKGTQRRAKTLGERIRAEDGIGNAVEILVGSKQ